MSQTVRRRALLVGIDTYVPPAPHGLAPAPEPGRNRWCNLAGSARDAREMAVLLQEAFGFRPAEIRLLLDREATRAALCAGFCEHLLAGAGPGDEVLFYYSGHGSRVFNSLSDEPDRCEVSLVPADSHAGEPDLRGREVRLLFDTLLDRGVRLTVILDCCHGGAGGCGLPLAGRRRQLPPDLRDVRDQGPRAARHAEASELILSACQGDRPAWEEEGVAGEWHGAFTRALIKAIQERGPDEPMERLFHLVESLLRTARACQRPVLAGSLVRRSAPLLGGGGRCVVPGGPPPVVVHKVRAGGRVTLRGGLAAGLHPGCQLTVAATDGREILLRVVAGAGDPADVEAVVIAGGSAMLAAGALCSLSSWNVAGGPSLSVWIPEHADWGESEGLAAELAFAAPAAGVRWIADPVAEDVSHVLGWDRGGWRLTSCGGDSFDLGPRPASAAVLTACAASAPLDRPAGLFVQLPCPPELSRALRLGIGASYDAVARADDPAEAHYVLAGRLGAAGAGPEYAWVRPGVRPGDESPLPPRSEWIALLRTGDGRMAPAILAHPLEEAALRIARIRAWLTLEAPPRQDFPYRLALRRLPEGDLRTAGELVDGETYGFVLYADPASLARWVAPRYVYVFVIDSLGKVTLLFPPPTPGGVDCLLPAPDAGAPRPVEIALGKHPSFAVLPPFGVDTYCLLTTPEPLVTPAVVEVDAVRHRGPLGRSALDELLSIRGGARACGELLTPAGWSLERLSFTIRPAGGG